MDIFSFRDDLVQDYSSYISSFINIQDTRIKAFVQDKLERGVLWPQPLIQLNPTFEPGDSIQALIRQRVLHPECEHIFRAGKSEGVGALIQLHKHQAEAIHGAATGNNYVLTTGTGSGKSLSYIIPIVNHVLCNGSGKGIQAIIVYPMNALANSQLSELDKYLRDGYPENAQPVTYARYTGQENDAERNRIKSQPPDILLTNYVMLELILTRADDKAMIDRAQGLRFLVLDELHTYRGRQGADVAMLVRRVRDRMKADKLQCIGTSATLSTEGTFEEQKAKVAEIASLLFGSEVKSQYVIGETLKRATPEIPSPDHTPNFDQLLCERVLSLDTRPFSTRYDEFVQDPLSQWIESTFGITYDAQSRRWARVMPQSISGKEGAASKLQKATNLDLARCEEAIKKGLLAGYNTAHPTNKRLRPFAFRLHQFISRGDTVYATLETEDKRYLTLSGQRTAPLDATKDGLKRILLPLAFCRECGQAYYCVWRYKDLAGNFHFKPRVLTETSSDDGGEAGFLYLSHEHPWPTQENEIYDRIPPDWIEDTRTGQRIKSTYKKQLPTPMNVGLDGIASPDGLACHFISAPFRFCLNCGVTYSAKMRSDFAKLASLSSEGRSTATTILSISAVRRLKTSDLDHKAKKLLSFTDNRQDASLQAGHFNDFIEIGLMRSALFRAVNKAGSEGLNHEKLTDAVFSALNLGLAAYAINPEVRYAAKTDTERAMKRVLGYRLYCDLKRGWRVTTPNLEQCGLLKIEYQSLNEICADQPLWRDTHPALMNASPQTRARISRTLLDFMRRSLSIRVDFLDASQQDQLRQLSSQKLIPPWALDENELLEHSHTLYVRPRNQTDDTRENIYVSARGGFGLYLRRTDTFSEYTGRLTMPETENVIEQLLEKLSIAGLVECVDPNHGYQIPASCMVWLVGDGKQPYHDAIAVPRLPDKPAAPNPFFIEYYTAQAEITLGMQAHEHTAQVPSEIRQARENSFRKGDLPVLYCSPTMELGVDIADLNVVNMRNVPPTPANYAQRSGRAGRNGQPALVFSYCSTGNSHDQYFFNRPQRMVAGSVTPPRLDLGNEELVRAHVHAIWLAETGASLGQSLKDLLDLTGDNPSLTLLPNKQLDLDNEQARHRALRRAQNMLANDLPTLQQTDWYSDDWLTRCIDGAFKRFDTTCDRWRSMYRAAKTQYDLQSKWAVDNSRSRSERDRAAAAQRQARAQLQLLTDIDVFGQSDFYSYRYFASEGFLPGYSFPRLPVSAFVPARQVRQKDEYLSRPRFLAISEFGPRSIVYHEGSRYIIHKVILPVDTQRADTPTLTTQRIKRCEHCGYLHPITEGDGYDLCQRCHQPMTRTMHALLRMQNVETRRRDRINSDEEERTRQGFEIITAVRFADRRGQLGVVTGEVQLNDSPIAKLTYAASAEIWRINLGWRRRANQDLHGFMLDVENGYWAKSQNQDDEEDTNADALTARTERVIPYVDDRRNCLIFEPTQPLSIEIMASLQAALKSAIQVVYQLEDAELAVEPLPDVDDRRQLLFYEAAEGGAGVLRRIVEDPHAIADIAREALRICHFDPTTGQDLHRAPRAEEDCMAACYDCLMNYGNQREHSKLDRQAIRTTLLHLIGATVSSAPTLHSVETHLDQLNQLTASQLERDWLAFLQQHKLRLPTHAQPLVADCHTRPDFAYENDQIYVYIDGPHHQFPERSQRDLMQQSCLEDMGYRVIRFAHTADWLSLVKRYPSVFGTPTL